MKLRDRIRLTALCAVMAAALSGCFTGVESTPRIGDSEVRRNQASKPTDEQLFLRELAPLPPRLWSRQGLHLFIDDARIGRVLTPGTDAPDSLAPRRVSFVEARPAVSLMGDQATDLIFTDSGDGAVLSLRVNVPFEALDTLERLDLPFAVDLDLIARTDSLLRGRTLYTATDQWFDGNGRAVNGLRHVPLRVDSVVVGSSVYPAAVFFTLTEAEHRRLANIGEGDKRLIFMSVGEIGASARNFASVFNFESPRRRYPEIDDDVWDLIIQGKVRRNMTPTECRLALGSPSNVLRVPTRGGMRESWSYPDGVYLVFDDGVLSQFRL